MSQFLRKSFGLLFIILALVCNPFFLGPFLSLDGNLDPIYRDKLIYLEVLLFSLGLFLIRYSKWKSKIKFLFIVLFFSVILLEFSLQMFPSLLGLKFANAIRTKYTHDYYGINEFDPVANMDFLKPNFQAKCFWNGHWWKHSTDKYGFRNLQDRDKADILLLGDSFVYGHGVNDDETVSFYLEKQIQRPVINMGRTGNTSVQHMYLLAKYGLQLSPQYVFYLFCNNDLTDLRFYRTEEEMKDFIQTPLHQIRFPDRIHTKKSLRDHVSPITGFVQKHLVFPVAVRTAMLKALDQEQDEDPSVSMFFEENSLEWKYMAKSIEYMKYLADKHEFEFVLVAIPVGEGQILQHFETLRKVSQKNAIPFIELPTDVQFAEEYVLVNDGHLNASGNQNLSRHLAAYLQR